MFTFAKFCRLCLKNDQSLVDYTEVNMDNISHYDKIKILIPELVADGDVCIQFPTSICDLCCKELDQFYVFYERCIVKHNLLKKYEEQLCSTNITRYSPLLSRSDEHDELPSSINNSALVKQENEISDNTILINENSTDSISIVKNEIPITKEEERNFELIIKTCLVSETDTNLIHNVDDNIINNQHESVIEAENITTGSDKIKETIIIKDASSQSQAPKDILKQATEKSENKELSSNNMKEKENITTGSDKIKETIVIEDVSSQAPKDILKQVTEQSENIELSSNNTKESSNQLVPDNDEESDNEESDENFMEETTVPPRLSLRKRRPSASITYNEVSDNEDFSADDDSDFEPEINVDSINNVKKVKYTHSYKNKLNPANASTLNTSSSVNELESASSNSLKSIVVTEPTDIDLPVISNSTETNLVDINDKSIEHADTK